MISFLEQPETSSASWHACRFLTCSVLPVRVACNLRCPFCFSKSSISTLQHDRNNWRQLDVAGYYRWAKENGATRLVITGGGEPLLRPDDVVYLIELGSRSFQEIACFTNGTYLTRELARRLQEAGLSYLCYSRHHHDDTKNAALMGQAAPNLADFVTAAGSLPIRATCVMTRDWIDDTGDVWEYIDALKPLGIREFTFKHTYVAYEHSVFQNSSENNWAADHRIEFDPFEGQGEVVAALPWGPQIRQLTGVQVCYYREPTPAWELTHRLCRSSNLLSDGNVYASLEDQRSQLYRLISS